MQLDKRILLPYLLVMGVEGCWLYALIMLISEGTVPGRISVLGLMLALPLSFLTTALLGKMRSPKALRRMLGWLAWAAVMLIMLKAQLYGAQGWGEREWLAGIGGAFAGIFAEFQPELLMLMAGAALWGLGQRLAETRPGFTLAVAEFQFGLAVLVLTFFSAAQLNTSVAGAVPVTLAFFILALLGVAVTHAREGTGWLAGRHRSHWSLLLVATVGLVLALGWAIVALVNPNVLAVVLEGLKWLWGLIMKVLAFFASLLPEPEPGQLPAVTGLPGPGEGGEDTFNPFTFSEEVRERIRIIWIVVVSGLLLLALWRVSSQIIAWLRRRLAGMSGAEVEPLSGAFRADLLRLLKFLAYGWLGLIIGRLFPPKPKPDPSGVAFARQIYRQVLGWAAGKGYRRRLSQTPHEFLDMLGGAAPETVPDLSVITDHYVRIRYGPPAAGPPDEGRLKLNWQTLRKIRLKSRGDSPDGQGNA